MSQFLSIEIGTNHLLFASASKTGEDSFHVDNVSYEPLSLNLEHLTLSLTSQLSELILTHLSDWQLGKDLIVSFNSQSTFLKTIQCDMDAPHHVIMESAEWEILQTTGGSRNEFSFSINEDKLNNKHHAIAMRNEKVDFAKELAIALNMNLSCVALNSANILSLLDTIGSNIIQLNVNEHFVEIAVIVNGHFDELLSFSYPDGIDINDININLRKIYDSMLTNGSSLEHIYASGLKINKSDAEHISNAVQVPIEIIDPFSQFEFTGELPEYTEKSAFCSCVGALFQV